MTTVLRVNLPNLNVDSEGNIIIKIPITVYIGGSMKTDSGEGQIDTPHGKLKFSCRGELREDTLFYVIKLTPTQEE